MSSRKFIWLGLFIGTTLGGFVPALWGGSLFSCSAVLFSVIGGLLGIWAGAKVNDFLG